MAAGNTFTVEVLTPEGQVFDGEVLQLSTRTVVGEIGILANHVPVLAALRPNLLRLRISESETRRWAQSHGMLQVFANHAQVLLEEAIPPDQLDVGSLEDQLEQSRKRLEEATGGSAAEDRANRDIERAEAFLKIARGE